MRCSPPQSSGEPNSRDRLTRVVGDFQFHSPRRKATSRSSTSASVIVPTKDERGGTFGCRPFCYLRSTHAPLPLRVGLETGAVMVGGDMAGWDGGLRFADYGSDGGSGLGVLRVRLV